MDIELENSHSLRLAEIAGKLLRGVRLEALSPSDAGRHAALAEDLLGDFNRGGPSLVKKRLKKLKNENSELAAAIKAHIKKTDPFPGIVNFSADELLKMDLPEPSYLVDGALPEGSTLLAGPPKVGKTMLALNIGLAIAEGTPAFGQSPVEKGNVLFLALEGSTGGLKRRIKKMLSGRDAPRNLHIVRGFPKLENGAVGKLRSYLRRRDIRLVIIDTLQALRGKQSFSSNRYEADYETLQPISLLAEEIGTSFIAVHHTNKRGRKNVEDVLDLVSGSTGLTGSVDNVLLLAKERGKKTGKLALIPREQEEVSYEVELSSETNTWSLKEFTVKAKTPERQEILDILEENGAPMSPAEIADQLSKPPNNVTRLLTKMKERGTVVQPAYGEYEPAAPVGGGNSDQSGNSSFPMRLGITIEELEALEREAKENY